MKCVIGVLLVTAFWSVATGVSAQENTEDAFKSNMVAVELHQEMETTWSLESLLIDAEPDEGQIDGIIVVDNFEFKYNKKPYWKCVGFNERLNAFEVINMRIGRSGLATIKDEKLIVIERYEENAPAPDTLSPSDGTAYWEFKRFKKAQ